MAIRQKGSKWQVDVTVKGVRAPRVSRDTQAEAKTTEAAFKAHLMAGGDPAELNEEKPKALAENTLGHVLELTHRERWAGTKAELSSYRNGEAWCAELGYDFPLPDLTPAKVVEVFDRWAVAGNKPGTINRKRAALNVMLTVAEDNGITFKRFKLPKRKEYEGRLRWYSDEELEDLLAHTMGLDPRLFYLFLIAVETGMRYSELMKLTKRDADLKSRVFVLGETKGDKRRGIPMTSKAKWAVQNLQTYVQMDHERLFPSHLTTRHISRVITAWKKKRGMPEDDEACFHTLRHTTCSRMVQRGVPIIVAKEWMGHASIETTMRYAHLAPNSLEIALRALEGETT